MIGNGPGGFDLVMMLSRVAKRVTLSRKKPQTEMEKLRQTVESALPQIIFKDEIKRFTVDGAVFADDTHETFTTIIHATGKYLLHHSNSLNSFKK